MPPNANYPNPRVVRTSTGGKEQAVWRRSGGAQPLSARMALAEEEWVIGATTAARHPAAEAPADQATQRQEARLGQGGGGNRVGPSDGGEWGMRFVCREIELAPFRLRDDLRLMHNVTDVPYLSSRNSLVFTLPYLTLPRALPCPRYCCSMDTGYNMLVGTASIFFFFYSTHYLCKHVPSCGGHPSHLSGVTSKRAKLVTYVVHPVSNVIMGTRQYASPYK